MSGGPTFRAMKTIEEPPYKMAKEGEIGFTKSWQTTANVKKSDSFQSVNKYVDDINKKVKSYQKSDSVNKTKPLKWNDSESF